jgi:hypothetical protein
LGQPVDRISILQQKERQRSREQPILIPSRMGLQVACERIVKTFGNFCQDAYSRIHE